MGSILVFLLIGPILVWAVFRVVAQESSHHVRMSMDREYRMLCDENHKIIEYFDKRPNTGSMLANEYLGNPLNRSDLDYMFNITDEEFEKMEKFQENQKLIREMRWKIQKDPWEN